jgi:primosomal protein N' (replication factor Y)
MEAKTAPVVGQARFAEMVVPVPLRRTFTYRLPESWRGQAKIGARVLVPFGKQTQTGYIVALHSELDKALGIAESEVKDALLLLDAEPLLTQEILRLTQWAADYYAASWGEILKASLPAGINASMEKYVSLQNEAASSKGIKANIIAHLQQHGETALRELVKKFGAAAKRAVNELAKTDTVAVHLKTQTEKIKPKIRKAVRLTGAEMPKKLTAAQQKVIEILWRGEIPLTALIENGCSASAVKTLTKKGVIDVFDAEVLRDPLREAAIPAADELKLTTDQTSVLSAITEAINAREFKTFLLHGVTGSGKTEVYIRAMRAALDLGKTGLMLVPEIALTPVFSRRLRAFFGSETAILHSSLSPGERFDEWRRIRGGEARIVIGTRSAIFAPLENLGVVIIDEEHDSSYRQQESPFYHARDLAVVRAQQMGAAVVLGSATPALESFYNSQNDKYSYLQLSNRIGERPLAEAELIDMRMVFREAGKDVVFSPQLIAAIEETHARGEQSIILLNRRGYSSFVLCRSCGESVKCPNCDVTLTFHKRANAIVCHYCNHRRGVPSKCPACAKQYIYFVGEGTEQIEDLMRRKFSHLRIARIDRDAVSRRKSLEQSILAFAAGELDMLVGTQMLAKGHDFHNVTLVGVVSVDAGLGMPDFRAAERAFQLLTQVAGRAGRGKLPGRVLIQTYHPDNYVLRHARRQDYSGFYNEEIKHRERYNFPPFVALTSLLIHHENYNYAHDNASILNESLKLVDTEKECRILGPAPAPLARLKGEHRLQILIKSRNRKRLRQILDMAMADAQSKFCDLRHVSLEIDPVNLL